MAVTPLDLVKCNMQIDFSKYKSISSGLGILLKEQGVKGFFKGWVPTLFGYSGQGACKIGFYEFFKKYYSDLVWPEFTASHHWRCGSVLQRPKNPSLPRFCSS